MNEVAQSRRHFLKVVGMGLLAYRVDGAEIPLTPKAARERSVPLRVLTPEEVASVEALGEGLVPGARDAGIAHFLDHQLAASPADSLLMLRYLDVPPPYLDFYRPALAAAQSVSRSRFDKPLADLSSRQMTELIGAIAQVPPEGWQGPPSPVFYFVLRSDAVDVVHGTPEGFEKLGLPYMAHIMPTARW